MAHNSFINQRLRELGATQQEFAAFSGMTPTSVSRWSQGAKMPPWVISMIYLLGRLSPEERAAVLADPPWRRVAGR